MHVANINLRRLLLPVAVVLSMLATMLVVTAAPAAAATCPCTIWPSTATPVNPADSDTAAVEVGVKFRSDVAGQITGIKFYKGSGNTGTHVGHLWSATGANLGTVTFPAETATGWQTATFATPITISANTTYVASYYAPNGHYAGDTGAFTGGGVDNAPLHALGEGVDGSNGVYRYGTGGGFPSSSWQSANYWVDVVFAGGAADTTPPAVSATDPANGATGVATTTAVSATFNEPVQAGTATVTVRAGTTTVTGATAYDAASRTVTFTPASALAAATAYTVTVAGARDTAGNTMTASTFTFTTGTGGSGCPCTIWPSSAVPATVSVADNSAVEVGVKFRSGSAGFITGLRFYKGATNTGTHTGALWTSAGTRLSTVTFDAESASGWQTATLPSPVAVTANTTYVASYHTDTGFYSATANGLASAVTRGPLTALASAANGGNGVYKYGPTGFPSSSFQATNYWVDVVFNTAATDNVAPTLSARAPGPGATGVPAGNPVTATFSEPVTDVAMTLTGPSGAVAGTTTYDANTATVTFDPTADLAFSTAYTAAVSGARDTAGNVMAPVSWSFTTAAAPPPPPDQGPGGPVLVIKSTAGGASGFTSFLSEVLRNEGINEFATANLSTVTATTLSQYDVVLLGQTPLTAAQVSMFTTWVNGGGNLIAFRPDAQLASLLGLTAATGTLADAYLKVDTATAPGAGITADTMQFHGTADRYTLNGARAVATLYSSATAATTNPAVSLVDRGTTGGQAAAFTFDLGQSLVYTRQGNPAWEGQDRDGQGPVRSDDMFFGGTSTDWVNLSKVAVPQADEQQRLLANLIGTMNLDRKPLPKFWYFPRSLKAVVVATGDDHGVGGTTGRYEQYLANSPAGCVVDNWECPRFTSYVFANTSLTNAQAATYQTRGFETALHLSTNCANYTSTSLAANWAEQLPAWKAKYTSLASPVTNRTHCIVWSDYTTQPTVERTNGVRLDTNYYYWPASWVANRPGFMTGSGMPMRFADKNGNLIDVYQAATQMTDESGQTYPFTTDSLLDKALGTQGYYGAFVANMHTDETTTADSDGVLSSALRHNVPVITAKQLLTWTDGRNASSYSGISWSGNALAFTVNVGAGANGLTGMVPTLGPGGRTLSTLTRSGTAVPFTRTTIKGVEYAMFQASPGAHLATYGSTVTATPATVRAIAGSTTAAVVVTGGLAANTTVEYGTQAGALTAKAADGSQAGPRTVILKGLRPSTRYFYRVTVTAPGGQATVTSVRTLTTRAADKAAPRVSSVTVEPRPDGTAAIGWRTDESASSEVLIGKSSSKMDAHVGGESGKRHSVLVTDLKPGKRYYYRVRSVDAAGNRTTSASRSFTASALGVADFGGVQLRTGTGSGTTVVGDELRVATGASSGVFTSRVLDARQMVTWNRLSYSASTAVKVQVRIGSTSAPDASWTGWRSVGRGDRVGGGSRYVQYRVTLTGNAAFSGLGITSNAKQLEESSEHGH